MTHLVVNNVTAGYGDTQVLHDVSLDLASSQLVGLLGANGAGKSTLLKILAGLHAPQSGDVLLGDVAIAQLTEQERSRRIAYLPQNRDVHWPLSVRALVMLGRLPHRGRFFGPSAADDKAVDAALDAADVAYLADRPVTELSGGERARVLLARALAVEAPLFLADEPVAGLDPAHQIDVMQLLAKLAHDDGRTVLVVLHDLSLAARYCDRVVLLAGSQVMADGSVHDVLTRENLSRAFGISAFIGEHEARPLIVPEGRDRPHA